MLEQARRAFLEAGDVEQAAECQTMLGDVRWRHGDRDAAFEQLEQAIDGLAKPSPAKAYALFELARMRNAASEPETAVALGREALEIADALELRELRVSALTTIGIARTLMGDTGGIDDLRRSVEAAGEIGSPESVRAYYNLGAMLGISGQLLASFDALAEGRRLAQRFGDAAWIAWYEAERLYEHYWRGAWDDALALADRLVSSASGDEPASVEFDASLVRAWIALARGNEDDALASVRRAHDLAREAPDPQNLHPALALRARATAELLDADGAAGYVDELLDDFPQRPTPPGYWVFDLAVASPARARRGRARADPLCGAGDPLAPGGAGHRRRRAHERRQAVRRDRCAARGGVLPARGGGRGAVRRRRDRQRARVLPPSRRFVLRRRGGGAAQRTSSRLACRATTSSRRSTTRFRATARIIRRTSGR